MPVFLEMTTLGCPKLRTGVIPNAIEVTIGTDLNMTAECGGTAGLQFFNGFQLV